MKKARNLMNPILCLSILAALVLLAPAAQAQAVPSQKAYLGAGTTEVLGPKGDVILSGLLKTSNVGDLMIGVSTECSLWTSTSTTAKKGGGTSTSTSRAAVNLRVLVDGVEAEPGQVVFCDREQQVSLTFASDTVQVTDSITLALFQKTKEANHFNFYLENLGTGIHKIEVLADSIVEADPNAPNTASDTTRAAIGKRSLVVEDFNNP